MNKPRCPTCDHRRGPRSTNNLTKGGHTCVTSGPGACFRAHKQTEAGQPRKAPCVCECHAPAPVPT